MISFSVSIDPLNRKCRGDAYIAPTVSSRITDEFGKFVTFYKGPMKGIGLYDHLFRQTAGCSKEQPVFAVWRKNQKAFST